MADPIKVFVENTEEVQRLVELHEEKTGKHRGRRYGVEVLNKSSIVLLTACWEAFVEDTATTALDYLLKNTPEARSLPEPILKKVAKWVHEDKNDLRIWDLAGGGWRKVLREFGQTMLYKYVSFFNTPKAGNVDDLLYSMLGLSDVSEKWTWANMSAQKARNRLAKYIELRGSIAHRVRSSETVYKSTVSDYRDFITRLAVRTANITRGHVNDLVGREPWPEYTYGSFR